MNARSVTCISGTQHLTCCKCKRLVAISGFYASPGGKPHSWCKPCYRDWRTARRESEPYRTRVPKVRERRPATPAVQCVAREQAEFLRLTAANTAMFTGIPLLQGGLPA